MNCETSTTTPTAGNSSDNNDEWRIALRQVIENLAKRNTSHKKYPELSDRTKETDAMILNMRHLLDTNETGAAQLHVRVLSYIDETDKIITQKFGSSNNVSSQILNLEQIRSAPNPAPGKKEKQKRNVTYSYAYSYYVRRWWKLFCFNAEKEAQDNNHNEVRDLFKTQMEFFLSCLGFIVGVGNTLRFPSMVYQHGGIFFIPYFISLFLFGMPLVYMHMCIGQYAGLSVSGAFWKMMPIASGIGWALVLLAVPVSIYYNVIVAWSLYYFWYSIKSLFQDTALPWATCDEAWVKKFHCCDLYSNDSCYSHSLSLTSTESWFHYQVLNRTMIAHPDIGDIQYHLVICLAISWIIVFFGVFKGIGSIGGAVLLTATVPYFLLFILLLRGVSLPGAHNGLKFFFYADTSKLWNIQIWRAAGEQVFYSLGIDAGPLISMASFSRYRNNIYRDAFWLVFLDTITSVLCGMVIFSFVGFLANVQQKSLTEILKHESLYLAFTVYPGVPAYMEWGPLWAALFFAMLILSSLDAEFAWLEMIASSIMNQFGSRTKVLEKQLLAGLCIFFFVGGLPFCTQGGIYFFHAIEFLNANWNSFTLSLLQIIIVCYVYGVKNFLEDVKDMLRIEKSPEPFIDSKLVNKYMKLKTFFGPTGTYVRWSWSFLSPIILTVLLISSMASYHRVQFNNTTLPWSYELVAWITMLGPLIIVPITSIYVIYEAQKNNKPLSSVIDSSNWRHQPKDDEMRQPQHQIDVENDYMYIDPLSRGPSAKSNFNVRVNIPDNFSYSELSSRLNNWKNQTSSESLNLTTIELATAEEVELASRKSSSRDDVLNDTRMTGRLATWEREHAKTPELQEPERPRFVIDYRETLDDDSPKSVSDDNTFNLFGPPPVADEFDNNRKSTVKYRSKKTRAAYRSDQKRNKTFDDTLNLDITTPVIIERASPVRDTSLDDDTTQFTPSPSDDASCDIARSSSNEMDHNSSQFLKPMKLKRPKPIGSASPM